MDLEWTTLKSVGLFLYEGRLNYRGKLSGKIIGENYRGKLSGKNANKSVVYPDISKVAIFGVRLPKLFIKQYNI